MSELAPTSLRKGYGNDERLGLVQHKREAWWFYRFLSIAYDRFVNPWHWTPKMRTTALQLAELSIADLDVLDVGGGTGFCTSGILEFGVKPEQVTLLDQSPHQMAKAKAKPALNGVTFCQGDAEDLPLPTDSYDRYVSAGSIEYWPEPQRGINEAYRVLRPGGIGIIIGPERATHRFSRWMSDMWMLFPQAEEYQKWLSAAGFEDIQIIRICPEHFGGIRQHGLIMGIVAKGRKKKPGLPQINLDPKIESSGNVDRSWRHGLRVFMRLCVGTIGGGYYFLLGFLIPVLARIRGPEKA